nr:uncharacterized protein LOC109741103 [Aegilops tauschii subsp. strangulata]
MAIFSAATRAEVGNGSRILFWEDRWLDAARIVEVAPLIYKAVSKRVRAGKLLKDAIHAGAWVLDIKPNLSFEALMQYLALWQRLQGISLQEDSEDAITWTWEANGQFSVRSAYAALFAAKEVEPTAQFTWKSKAPLRCRFFVWLAMKKRC